MKRLLYIIIVIAGIFIYSCDLLEEEAGLSTEEIVEGLKTALAIGTDTSVAITPKVDGYYKDEAIKILLPDDAQAVYNMKDNALIQALNIDDLLENMVVSLNRAAEDAATEAKPIFKNSITNLSISDGWEILNGTNPAGKKDGSTEFDSTAATNYLRSTTFAQLKTAFSPKIGSKRKVPS